MNNILDKQCDLHIHSSFSDSDAKPEDIFKTAKTKGLFCIAIADHDTVGGQDEAQALSKVYGIENISAIEVSAKFKASEIHILGYFIDCANAKLKDSLKDTREFREARLLAMADKLISLGVKVDKEKLLLMVKDITPTRLHLARYLAEKGAVNSLWEAFKKYLSPNAPAYVSRLKYSAEEAIQLIKGAGGLAFLAHPQFLAQTPYIDEVAGLGIDGLEVVYPRLPQDKISRLKKIAEKYNLLKSGGSDAHGSYKKFTEIGIVKISYQWVEQMKARLTQIKALKY